MHPRTQWRNAKRRPENPGCSRASQPGIHNRKGKKRGASQTRWKARPDAQVCPLTYTHTHTQSKTNRATREQRHTHRYTHKHTDTHTDTHTQIIFYLKCMPISLRQDVYKSHHKTEITDQPNSPNFNEN